MAIDSDTGIETQDEPSFRPDAIPAGVAHGGQALAMPDSTVESSTDTPEVSTPASSLSALNTKPQSPSKDAETGDDELLPHPTSYIAVGVLKKSNADDKAAAGSDINRLEAKHWIWIRAIPCQNNPQWSYVRVYVLPDDVGQKSVPRSERSLRRALQHLMATIDPSVEAWEGQWVENETGSVGEQTTEEDESLWYIFNTLEDPKPQVEVMGDPYARRAMEELMAVTTGVDADTGREFTGVTGLKTSLYPYQRRSAASMVQREAQPAQVLDPRLQAFKGPSGQEYFYDKETGSFVREKRMYSEACGGILAETMGCGKTLICLAVILATRGHVPQIPSEYQETANPVRDQTASLVEMAAAAAGRFSLPWKGHFDYLSSRYGVSYTRCIKSCEDNRGEYTIPSYQTKYGRRDGVPFPRMPPQHLVLCSGTLIVVPPNLVDHWEHEITNHTEGLKVLILKHYSVPTPSQNELLEHDIVLFSRTRFEKETGEVVENRRDSAKQEDSPLTKLHWLRIIVDEGHNVAGHRSNMAHLLDKLHVERRWVVSGTPSSGLFGVEVSLASQETSDADLPEATTTALQRRKRTGNAIDSENKDLDSLRRIAVKFLDLKPWSNSKGLDQANWTTYIKPLGKDGKRRKAPSLRATLQSLVVRHRLDVIHGEVPLPQLHNKVVYLEPTFYDKLSLNLFIFNLEINAITSERTDQDYMFHPRNRRQLSTLIGNLREAGFWWIGGGDKDVSDSVDRAQKYLEENRDRMSEADIATLTQGIQIAQNALSSPSWHAFRKLHELGVFVQDFPAHARDMWALSSDSDLEAKPLLLGISQARKAQSFITSHLDTYDPAEGLAGAGIKVRNELAKRDDSSTDAAKKGTPEKPKSPRVKTPKKQPSNSIVKSLPPDSPLGTAKLIGTASAKLTYLLDQVQELHKTEKIIIFYDNPNSAFWISEGLEMLGIEFRIYASTLRPHLRTEYLDLFRNSEEVRVLVMDLRQASHGLHIAVASRVFIVNPIWQPTIESQAIKRAHRIGQTRPVFVETLVLKDTLEDKMLRRRREISDTEAEKDLLDDNTMSHIIQDEKFIPMGDEAATRVAYLKNPQGFFNRHTLAVPDEPGKGTANAFPIDSPRPMPARKRKLAGIASTPTNEPDLLTPIKRRKSSLAGREYVNEHGILMTPPSRTPSRRTSRSPALGLFTPPLLADPGSTDDPFDDVVAAGPSEKKKSVSIFGPGPDDE